MSVIPSPENVASDYLVALQHRDWQSTAALVDIEFVERCIGGFAVPMPNVGDRTDVVSRFFPGWSTIDEVRNARPREAFARLLEGWASGSRKSSADLRRLERIVGAVVDGTFAHVVYLARWEAESVASPRVVLLRRDGAGHWAILPSTEQLEAAGETLFTEPFSMDW